MTTLYSCRHAGDQYRITKFDNDMNVEASYLCTVSECECPAGVRDTCRHRTMLHKFMNRNAVNTNWFYDYNRDGWVQTDLGEALSGSIYTVSEQDCPGHARSYDDNKVCRYCGTHIDSLRPLDDGGVIAGTATASVDTTANITASEIDERMANHPFPTSPIVEHLVDKTYEAVQALAPAAKPFRRGL